MELLLFFFHASNLYWFGCVELHKGMRRRFDALTGERRSKVSASHRQGGEKTPAEVVQKAKRSFKPLPVDTQLLTVIPESEPGSPGR